MIHHILSFYLLHITLTVSKPNHQHFLFLFFLTYTSPTLIKPSFSRGFLSTIVSTQVVKKFFLSTTIIILNTSKGAELGSCQIHKWVKTQTQLRKHKSHTPHPQAIRYNTVEPIVMQNALIHYWLSGKDLRAKLSSAITWKRTTVSQ